MKFLKYNNVIIIVIKKVIIELLLFKIIYLIILKNVNFKGSRLLYIRNKYIQDY